MRLISLIFLLFLAGCETLAPRVDGPADHAAWEARSAWLQTLNAWGLEGRVAIAAYDDGWNASVDWIQNGARMDVNFSGPLGAGSARVAGTPDRLEVHTTDGEHFITTDPETDLYWNLGWTAPLDRMPYWILGMPSPNATAEIDIDGAGRLRQLTEGGWTVTYTDYLLLDDGHALPRRIEMQRKDIRIRLVVSDWQLDPRT